MANKIKDINIFENIVRIKKSSQLISYNLIEYNKGQYEVDFQELMIKGYEDMAKINLEFSQVPFECENADINEYENWLCGV